MTLEERVRYQIGQEGPQFDTREQYEERIEDILERMTAGDLLKRISWELEERGIHFKDK
jgi:hypothetical protein